MGVGDDGGGPIDQGPFVAVDEQVERVEVAVANDPRVVRICGELLGRACEVRPPDGGSLCGKAFDEVLDLGLTSRARELAVQPVDRTVVEGGRGCGE